MKTFKAFEDSLFLSMVGNANHLAYSATLCGIIYKACEKVDQNAADCPVKTCKITAGLWLSFLTMFWAFFHPNISICHPLRYDEIETVPINAYIPSLLAIYLSVQTRPDVSRVFLAFGRKSLYPVFPIKLRSFDRTEFSREKTNVAIR